MGNKKKLTPRITISRTRMHDAHVLFEEDLWQGLVQAARTEYRVPAVMARLLVREALEARAKKSYKGKKEEGD
jgi:TRAP-type C4-dicarboxylate transport system substrate-binding protein